MRFHFEVEGKLFHVTGRTWPSVTRKKTSGKYVLLRPPQKGPSFFYLFGNCDLFKINYSFSMVDVRESYGNGFSIIPMINQGFFLSL